MKKRLTRNTKDKLVAGVMSGLAEYFDQDAVLFRLLGAALFIFTGFVPFGLFYVFAWVIIPEDSAPDYEVVD
ncbi:MAG: phage shock protein C [Candidatus Paceibacteria bacterium]|jgi:phage shock protein PspC (stress-responsive transcriptional regulator)